MPAPVRRPTRHPSHRRALLAALLAGSLAAPLAACDDLGPDPAHVQLRYHEVAPLGRDRLVVTFDVPGHQWYFEGTDLQPTTDDGWLAGREIDVGSDGELLMRLALRDDGDGTVARADATIPLAHGLRWRVDVFPSALDEAAACGACNGIHRVAIDPEARPSARDWLYITWTALSPGTERD
ncbi:MAG TPA: hypothetical protein VFS08_10665 [Gemmatimonadaceae bacterium]|nr:hypothetical protein [Gemmatimonadaceae bacterium]